MNLFSFKIKWEANDHEKINFDVVSLTGTEAISQHYEFTLELRSSDILEKTNPLLRKATLVIQMENKSDLSSSSQKSTYHGLIFEFSQLGKVKDHYHYKATLAPQLAKLKYTKKSDVYIQSSLSDILTNVLNEHNLHQEGRKFEFNTQDSKYHPSSKYYNRYNYVCQYEESDYDFMNRLLERDGVYYYFKQSEDEDTEQVIITDHKEKHLSRHKSLKFRKFSDQTAASDPNSIHFFEKKNVLVPQKVTIMNYCYEKANQGDNGVISCSANVSKDGKLDHNLTGEEFIYGENFINPENQGDGQFLISIRAQTIYCHSKACIAKSTAVPISAGMKIKLDDHKNDQFNGEYLVTEVIHEGHQNLSGSQNLKDNPLYYENTLVLIPAHVQFRPKLRTAWPRIYGTMNALIDGEQNNQQPELDGTGRYKIRLPFLKTQKEDGKGSIWVRLATPYAGNSYGFHFPLHKGVEVILSFRDGNPDLPVIIGAVYNSLNNNIIVDKNSTLGGAIVTQGGNVLVMDDAKGAHSIGFSANSCWRYFK